MQSRIRKFYNDVEDILAAIDLKGKDHSAPEQEVSQTSNELNEDVSRDQNETCLQNEFVDKRRDDLLRAVRVGTAEELTSAIEWAVLDGCETILKEEIYSAKLKLKLQTNFERIKESLRDMRPSLVSELRSYSKPPKIVYDVMLCVYLLLGVESEDRLKSWSSIQSLMHQSGKYNLKRLIEYRQLCDIPTDMAERVKVILSNYDFQQIYLASSGAAAFYVWIMEMIDLDNNENLT